MDEIVSNQQKLRLVMLIDTCGPMTAKQILALDMGYSRSSLYRMLSSLEESGVLRVVRESRVRAVTEKTYDVCRRLREFKEGCRGKDADEYNTLLQGFLLNIMGEFESYARREGSDPAEDATCFDGIHIFGTREECEDAVRRIREIVEPMTRKTSDDQEAHTMVVILTPPFRAEPEAEGGAAE